MWGQGASPGNHRPPLFLRRERSEGEEEEDSQTGLTGNWAKDGGRFQTAAQRENFEFHSAALKRTEKTKIRHVEEQSRV